MKPVKLVLTETPDGLKTQLYFELDAGEKLPNVPRREKAVLDFLGECLQRIEAGEQVNIGFSENDAARMRRDDWLVDA